MVKKLQYENQRTCSHVSCWCILIKLWQEACKEVFHQDFPQEPTVTLMAVTPEGLQQSDNMLQTLLTAAR